MGNKPTQPLKSLELAPTAENTPCQSATLMSNIMRSSSGIMNPNISTPVHKEDTLTQILNAASNFWLNYQDMSLVDHHRKVSKYPINQNVKIYCINDAIVTEEEFRAAKKIETFYVEYMKKRPITPPCSSSRACYE